MSEIIYYIYFWSHLIWIMYIIYASKKHMYLWHWVW